MTQTYRYIATEKGGDAYSKHIFMFTHLLTLDQHVMDVLMDTPEDTPLGVKGITNRVREKRSYQWVNESDVLTTLEMLIKEGFVARLEEE